MMNTLKIKASSFGSPAWGVFFLLGTSLFFTGNSWLIKEVKNSLDFWQLGLARWGVGLILLWVMAKASGFHNFRGQRRSILILRGLTGTVGYLLSVASLQLIPISQATVLFFTCPMFAAINGIWVNQQPITFKDCLFIVVGFAGVITVLQPAAKGFSLQSGHYIMLVSAFFASISMNLTRKLAAGDHPYTIYFYFCLVGGATSFVPAMSHSDFSAFPGWWVLGCLAGASVLTSLGQVMMNVGLKSIPAHTGAVLMSSQVVFTAIVGVVFLDEKLTWTLVLGSCLILGGGAMLSHKKKSKQGTVIVHSGGAS